MKHIFLLLAASCFAFSISAQNQTAYIATYKTWDAESKSYDKTTLTIAVYNDGYIYSSTGGKYENKEVASTLYHDNQLETIYSFFKYGDTEINCFELIKGRQHFSHQANLEGDFSQKENTSTFMFDQKKSNHQFQFISSKAAELLGLNYFQTLNGETIPLPEKIIQITTREDETLEMYETHLVSLKLLDENELNLMSDYKTKPEETPELKARLVGRLLEIDFLAEHYK